MAYHHVLISTAAKNREELIFRDLSLGDLKRLFIQPYWSRQELTLSDGRIIKTDEIVKRRVFETDRPFDDEHSDYIERSNAEREKLNIGSPVVFMPAIPTHDDVAEFGKDISTDVLTKGWCRNSWERLAPPNKWIWTIIGAIGGAIILSLLKLWIGL